MNIRYAQPSDVGHINGLINYYIKNTNVNLEYNPLTIKEQTIWYEKHKGIYPIIVAEKDGKFIGFASLSQLFTKRGFLRSAELSIYIKPEQRGKGIGIGLMEKIIEIARNEGIIKNIVSLITSDNDASIKLHKKMGFEETGCYKNVAEKFNEIVDVSIFQLFLQ